MDQPWPAGPAVRSGHAPARGAGSTTMNTPSPSDAAVESHPTIADPWTPRTAAWLGRSPSKHAGRPGRPLLIGACPRSGTTLLRSLLDNNPDLAIPPETDFVIPLWRTRPHYGDLREEANRRRLAEWIFLQDGHGGKRLRFQGQRERQLTPEEAVERVVAAGTTLGSMFAACFALYAESSGKPRWGDKRPAYAGNVDVLFRLFPDAQFINVVRDPRGSVSSLMGLRWHREQAALAASTATWEMSVQRVDRSARRLRPDQLLDVRYEDLVRDPERKLAEICAWAGLPDDEAAVRQMLTGERTGGFRPGWHDKLREPVNTSSVASWRERLGPRQVALVEQATAPLMERFGYRPVAGPRVAPKPADLKRLAMHRQRRVTRWKLEDRNDLKRRLWLSRRPVAAERA